MNRSVRGVSVIHKAIIIASVVFVLSSLLFLQVTQSSGTAPSAGGAGGSHADEGFADVRHSGERADKRNERLLKQFARLRTDENQVRRGLKLLKLLEGMRAEDFPGIMPEVADQVAFDEYPSLIMRWTAVAPSEAFDFVASGQARPLYYYGVPPAWELALGEGRRGSVHEDISAAFFCDDLDPGSGFYQSCHRYNGGLCYIISRWASRDLHAAAAKVEAFRESLHAQWGAESMGDTGQVIRRLWARGDAAALDIDRLVANARLHAVVSMAAFATGEDEVAIRVLKRVDPQLQRSILCRGPLAKLMPGLLARSSPGPEGKPPLKYRPLSREAVEREMQAASDWINTLHDRDVRMQAALAALPVFAGMDRAGCLAWVSRMGDGDIKRPVVASLAELWVKQGSSREKAALMDWALRLPALRDAASAERYLDQWEYRQREDEATR